MMRKTDIDHFFNDQADAFQPARFDFIRRNACVVSAIHFQQHLFHVVNNDFVAMLGK